MIEKLITNLTRPIIRTLIGDEEKDSTDGDILQLNGCKIKLLQGGNLIQLNSDISP